MKAIRIFSTCLLLLPFVSCTQVANKGSDAATEKKVESLLSRMTLEEKIGQMNQITSYGNIEDMSSLIKKGEVGSILNEVDPVRINALQRVAMEESRLGIPLLIARDVIHGFKTIFPIPLGQAASFNPQIAKDGARVAAVEASSVGIRWTFAPMIDVARDPRWGRMAAGCGEDTYLTSVMGAAMVKGFQGDSLNNPTSIAACPKHFVGYGAAEGGRDYNSTFIPERRLRNVYLPPFEAAAKAGVAAIVAANAEEAAEKAAHIVGLLPANNLTGPAIFEFEQPTAVLSANAEPAKAAAALIDKDSAVEMYAGFGKNVYTAFATIGGNAVGVVATGKELCHNCVAKASRFVRLCDAFSVPVLTIVNTEGFVPSTSDDVAGGIREAARLAATYADATTAKVALIAGKAVGPVYTALAAADLKIAVKGCTISALEPSAAVSVLYKEEIDASDNIVAATKAKAAAYVAEVCSADAAVAAGSADMICEAANARASVVAAFELLSTKRAARLPKKHGNMAL